MIPLNLLLTPLTLITGWFTDLGTYIGLFVASWSIDNITGQLGGWVDKIKNNLIEKLQEIDLSSNIGDFFKDTSTKFKDGISTMGSNIATAVGDAFTDAVNDIKDSASNLGTSIKDTITGWFS
jgi:methyl-accepting chemotaxis protein